MSTQLEYVAAAKAYANATRRAKEAEAAYTAALQDLTVKQGTQASTLATLIQVAAELPQDVP